MQETILEFKDVSKNLEGKPVLSRVSFCLEKGKVLGILGSSGSGKTTLFNLLTGLDEPSAGHILVGGKNYEFEYRKLRKIIGMVPQQLSFYESLNVTENLTYYCTLYGFQGSELRRRVDDVLTLTQLKTRSNLPSSTLSPGLKRRLNLACALVHSPPILVVDEPAEDIDAQNREFIFSCLHSLASTRKMSIVCLSDFKLELETVLDRVVLLQGGKVLADNTIQNLIRELDGGLINLNMEFAGSDTLERLEEAPYVKDIIRGDDHSFIIRTSDAQKALIAILHVLQNLSGEVREVKVLKPNFESVFRHYSLGRESGLYR